MNVYVHEYRKIEQRTRRRDRFVWRYLPSLLLIGAVVVVGKIYVQSVALRWSDRVVEMRTTVHDLELETMELRSSIAEMSTRDHVARLATDRLGMVTPTEVDVVWLPVPDRTPGPLFAEPETDPRGPVATVVAWLDAFWQEEALALTSQ